MNEELLIKAERVAEALRQGLRAAESIKILSRALVSENKLTDNDICALEPLYPDWTTGVSYRIGDVLRHENKLYRVTQPHESQVNWSPDRAINLFCIVQVPSEGQTLPWTPYEAVTAGDRRVYNGVTYLCLLSHTTLPDWAPPGQLTLWSPLSG